MRLVKLAPRAKVVLCALSLAALALVAFAIARRSRAPVASAVVPMSARFAWTAGKTYAYALEAHTRQRARLGAGASAQAIEGELTLDGQLVVRCYRAEAGRFTLGVSLPSLRTASLVVSGAEGLRDPAEIVGHEAFVEVDDRGRVGRVLFRKEDSSTFKYLMQSLVGLLQITLPEAPSREWDTEEPTMLGRARARYSATDAPAAFTRVHSAYTLLVGAPDAESAASAKVDSDDRASLSADGAMDALHVNERVVVPSSPESRLVADVTLDLRRVSEGTFVPEAQAFDGLEARRLNEVSSTADVKRAMHERIAADMTPEKMELTIAAYGAGATLPPGFLTSAQMLVKLHPEFAGVLVELFERPETNSTMRTLVCDILVSAGTPQAQASLVDALQSDAARAEPKAFPALAQRVGLVTSPEKATLDFALAQYAHNGEGPAHVASAYALGSSIGARARGGALGDVAESNKRLRADLSAARTAGDRVTVLAALGNAGLPGNVDVIRQHASDAQPEVRKQAAIALRKTDTADVHETLMDMLDDSDASVGLASLSAIASQSMTPDRMRELATFATTRAYPGEINEALLTLVGDHPELGKDEISVLRAILASSRDPHTRARAQMLLGQIANAGGRGT